MYMLKRVVREGLTQRSHSSKGLKGGFEPCGITGEVFQAWQQHGQRLPVGDAFGILGKE